MQAQRRILASSNHTGAGFRCDRSRVVLPPWFDWLALALCLQLKQWWLLSTDLNIAAAPITGSVWPESEALYLGSNTNKMFV